MICKICGVSNNKEIWGKIGILFNNSKINKNIKKSILRSWKANISIEGRDLFNGDFKFLKNEKACITNDGELDTNWPIPIDDKDSKKVSEFDLLIAAVTKPKHGNKNMKCYSNVQEIAFSVKNDDERHYFINNIKTGITTFQDNAILNK
jgi:hypothetical protein